MSERETLRIAAVADLHMKKSAQGTLQPLFARATEDADVILLCGDLTDYGTLEETKILAKEITSSLRIPAIGVLGNYDPVHVPIGRRAVQRLRRVPSKSGRPL